MLSIADFAPTTGEILIFLGADDPLMTGSIETLVDALVKNPEAGVVYCDLNVASGKPIFT